MQNYQELIDKYLKDEMSAEERVEFEKRLSKDKGLRKEYELTSLIAEELLDFEMREQIMEWHSQIDNEMNQDEHKGKAMTNKKKKNMIVLSILAVAASLIIGVIFVQHYLPDNDPTKESSFANNKPVDTTRTVIATPIQTVPTANIKKGEYLDKKQEKAIGETNIIQKTPIVADLKEKKDHSSLEPQETDAEALKSITDYYEREKKMVYERYKNSKNHFCELFTDSAVAEKMWVAFIQNPTDEKWTLLKFFLDERNKNPKKTTFALRKKLSEEMQAIAKKANY